MGHFDVEGADGVDFGDHPDERHAVGDELSAAEVELKRVLDRGREVRNVDAVLGFDFGVGQIVDQIVEDIDGVQFQLFERGDVRIVRDGGIIAVVGVDEFGGGLVELVALGRIEEMETEFGGDERASQFLQAAVLFERVFAVQGDQGVDVFADVTAFDAVFAAVIQGR
jgi:hypothetical protein